MVQTINMVCCDICGKYIGNNDVGYEGVSEDGLDYCWACYDDKWDKE